MDQSIRFSCSGCSRPLKAAPHLAGKKSRCSCGIVVTVPANAPEQRTSSPCDIVSNGAASLFAESSLDEIEGGRKQDIEQAVGAGVEAAFREFRGANPTRMLNGRAASVLLGALLVLASLGGFLEGETEAALLVLMAGLGIGSWSFLRSRPQGTGAFERSGDGVTHFVERLARRKTLLFVFGGFLLVSVGAVILGGGGPPSGRGLARHWVKRQVHEALGQHGSFHGDEWTTIHLDHSANSGGSPEAVFRHLTIKGLEVECEDIELTPADRLNDFQWGFHVSLKASAYRYEDARGQAISEWSDGAGPLSFFPLLVQKQKGDVYWAVTNIFSFLVGADVTTDQANVFDSVLRDEQHPSLGADRLSAIFEIADVLQLDDRLSKQVGVGRNQRAEVVRDYLPLMRSISLSRCPRDFQMAYRLHIDAWRRVDSAAIDTTWDQVIAIARRYGVGTVYPREFGMFPGL